MDDLPREILGPELTSAFEKKGYASLTQVQRAVLDPKAEGRDLRITSQTGSGKTVAIGLVLRALAVPADAMEKAPVARPRALVITPTRELGRQVEEELGWLYAPFRARVVAVTGGTSYRDEHRALAARPSVLVATPGRLLDHLERGSIDPSAIGAVVLDEADRMLDMGFSEALQAILSQIPEGRRTHLVSATFPPDVRQLADRVQSSAMHVEGTRLGAANTDIQHRLVLVDPAQRFDALVNLLLSYEGSRTLVFSRTRAAVAEIAERLADTGFAVSSISGDMAQNERTRALAAFKRGSLRILVATDVAARGIDVSDVTLVLHVETPTDPDSYTHRAGRTGRAGRKGLSIVLVAPQELSRARRVLSQANVPFRIEPLPTADAIRAQQDENLIEALTDETESTESAEIDARTAAVAARLVAAGSIERTLARLLAESGHTKGPEPRQVRIILPPDERPPARKKTRDEAPFRDRDPRAPKARDERDPRASRARDDRHEERDARAPRSRDERATGDAYTVFQVSWGERHGADSRRLLAMVCRRGGIESRDVGAIRIGAASSTVEVRSPVAVRFATAAMRPDPRDPRVRIRPLPAYGDAPVEESRPGGERRPARTPKPKPKAHRGQGGTAPRRRSS